MVQSDGGLRSVVGGREARRAVFLDRDGVINAMWWDPEHGTVDSPANPDQLQLLPGVGSALQQINRMGFLAVVISNQPGVAKKKFTEELLQAITEKMVRELKQDDARLDAIYYCLHHPEGIVARYRRICECRKPKPGLILQAARELGIDPSSSYMVGDGVNDVEAGRNAGCTTIWVGQWKCDMCQVMAEKGVKPDCTATSLLEAVRLVQQREAGDGDLY
jgi:D-glycero-D-manno-heptose 1,7-bisphosphate phosphatase